MLTLRLFLGGSIVAGLLVFGLARATARDSGPGTGFKGYTTGFRVKLWLMHLIALALLLQGVLGLIFFAR